MRYAVTQNTGHKKPTSLPQGSDNDPSGQTNTEGQKEGILNVE